jgi:hypothetical protein
MEAQPALRLTPDALAPQVRQASKVPQQQGRRELADAVQRMDRWGAGARLMRTADAASWNEIEAGAALMRANRTKRAGCRAAATTGRPQSRLLTLSFQVSRATTQFRRAPTDRAARHPGDPRDHQEAASARRRPRSSSKGHTASHRNSIAASSITPRC